MKKMFLVVLLCFALVMTLTACDEKTVNEEKVSDEQAISSVEEESAGNVEETTEAEEPAEATRGDWKQFLADYEAWTDRYVEILKEYTENPTDTTILEEYLSMIEEAEEWEIKAAEYKKELENSPEMLAEYTETTMRIVEKMTSWAIE